MPSHQIRETDDRIILSADWTPRLGKWLYVGLAVLAPYLMVVGYDFKLSNYFNLYIFIGLFFVFCVVGVFIQFFDRDDIIFDVRARRILRRQGFALSFIASSRSFDLLKGVVLEKFFDVLPVPLTSGIGTVGARVAAWKVSVDIEGEKEPLTLVQTSNEGDAISDWEHFAKKLGVMAIDKTGESVREVKPSDLDRPLREILASEGPASRELPPLPAATDLKVEGKPGRCQIRLMKKEPLDKKRQLNSAIIVNTLGSAVFALIGLLFLADPPFPDAPASSLASLAYELFGVLLIVIPVGYAARLWIKEIYGRTTIIEEYQGLTFCKTVGNRKLDPVTIKKSEIKDIHEEPDPYGGRCRISAFRWIGKRFGWGAACRKPIWSG